MLLVFTACASVGGNHQVVPIDSKPRGLDVYIVGEAQPVGSTPFFYNMQRVPHDTFMFRSAETGIERPFRLDCSFRWGTAFVGNSIMALANPAAAVSGIAMDLTTGAAFDCSKGILAGLQVSQPDPHWVSYCRRFVVLPPQHFDSRTSDSIAKLWQKANIENLHGCDQFVNPSNSRDLFNYLSIDHLDQRKAKAIGRSQLNLIGYRTSGTHLVQLDYEESNGSLSFTPKTYDIFTLLPDKTTEFKPQKIPTPERLHFSSTEAFFFHSLALFPNSITYGTFGGGVAVHGTGANEVKATDANNIFRQYVDKISLTSTSHPLGFDDWDYEINTFPSLELNFDDYEIVTSENTRKKLRFESITPLYGVRLAFFTLLGTISIDWSAGPVLLHQSYGDDQVEKNQIGAVSQQQLTYTAFITENFFLQVGAGNMRMHRRLISGNEFKYDDSTKSTVARVGYFVPWIKTDIRSLLSR
jgi:hypothetical protein